MEKDWNKANEAQRHVVTGKKKRQLKLDWNQSPLLQMNKHTLKQKAGFIAPTELVHNAHAFIQFTTLNRARSDSPQLHVCLTASNPLV